MADIATQTPHTQPTLFAEEPVDDYFDALCDVLQVDFGPTRHVAGWPDRFGRALNNWAVRTNNASIKTLSLFSGLGGLDIAFHDAGFSITTLLEIDERFVRTLLGNTGDDAYLEEATVLNMDVREFDPTGLSVDFIIGGPPCQSFSAAARRASGVSGINDDRGTLFKEYVRILDVLRPKGFLFENVYGITGANKGKAWEEIRAAFTSVGYTVSFLLLDAADYGVPQHRERMFIVGMKKGHTPFLFPRPTHGPDSRSSRPFYTAGSAVHRAPHSQEEPVQTIIGGRYATLLEQIPPGLNYSFFTENMGHPRPLFSWRSKFSDFLYKSDPERPVRTLKAQGGQYTGPFHWDSRPFTVGELKRLQTLPDAYNISGSRQVAIHQIGNSVPPQMARLLALSVLDQLFGYSPPAAIDYLTPTERLSFRSRKRGLTRYYRDKAKEALSQLTTPTALPVEPRTYKAVLDSDFSLRSVEDDAAQIVVEFSTTSNSWHVLVGSTTKNNSATGFRCVLIPVAEWALPVPEVVLSSTELNKATFTSVWKAFEQELNRLQIKADLVQLSGYYQYPPAFSVACEMKGRGKDRQKWAIVQRVVNGVGVGRTTHRDDLALAWELPNNEVLASCQFLKDLGFEVRNSATNPEIPSEHFLVPYSFPSLSRKSVQLHKQLSQGSPHERR